ncbi:MAG TPA: hypothetical protein VL371_22210 [Gemmataceae bacterium]|jgi:hypothetical protein|nr:hypothetical protein [Gemmataceae bacterium]
MNLSWKNWLGAGLVAPAVALGCSSTGKHHQDGGCANCTAAANVQAPPAYTVAAAMPRNVVTHPQTPDVMTFTKPPEVNHEMAIRSPEQAKSPVTAPKTVVSATGAPAPYTGAGYYHSADYATLVGELHYNPRQNSWRLRYAGIDEEDRYGGSVTLHNVGREMSEFKTGQYVRVEGAMVEKNSREVSPKYTVRDILPASPRQ